MLADSLGETFITLNRLIDTRTHRESTKKYTISEW